eukprot:1158801-Pelagomonas_calceolata.AAC.21
MNAQNTAPCYVISTSIRESQSAGRPFFDGVVNDSSYELLSHICAALTTGTIPISMIHLREIQAHPHVYRISDPQDLDQEKSQDGAKAHVRERESDRIWEARIGQHIFVDKDDQGAEHNPEDHVPASNRMRDQLHAQAKVTIAISEHASMASDLTLCGKGIIIRAMPLWDMWDI